MRDSHPTLCPIPTKPYAGLARSGRGILNIPAMRPGRRSQLVRDATAIHRAVYQKGHHMGLGKKLLKTSPVGFAAVKAAERKQAKEPGNGEDPEQVNDQAKQDLESGEGQPQESGEGQPQEDQELALQSPSGKASSRRARKERVEALSALAKEQMSRTERMGGVKTGANCGGLGG
jgi:hypothetical protein